MLNYRVTESCLGGMRKQQSQQATNEDSCYSGLSSPNPDVADWQKAVNKA